MINRMKHFRATALTLSLMLWVLHVPARAEVFKLFLTTNTVTNPFAARGLHPSTPTIANTGTRVVPPNASTNNMWLPPLRTNSAETSASLPSATTSSAWIFDRPLTGLTLAGGQWTLTNRYRTVKTGGVELSGNLYYRIMKVAIGAAQTFLKSYLTTGTNGWVQWGTGPMAKTNGVWTSTTAVTTI